MLYYYIKWQENIFLIVKEFTIRIISFFPFFIEFVSMKWLYLPDCTRDSTIIYSCICGMEQSLFESYFAFLFLYFMVKMFFSGFNGKNESGIA